MRKSAAWPSWKMPTEASSTTWWRKVTRTRSPSMATYTAHCMRWKRTWYDFIVFERIFFASSTKIECRILHGFAQFVLFSESERRYQTGNSVHWLWPWRTYLGQSHGSTERSIRRRAHWDRCVRIQVDRSPAVDAAAWQLRRYSGSRVVTRKIHRKTYGHVLIACDSLLIPIHMYYYRFTGTK